MENNKITFFFLIKKGKPWIPDKEKMLFEDIKEI